MPHERTITVYLFEELTDKAKETARDWYRQGLESDWSETVTEDATTIATMLGFCDPKFFWSGFSSQGDGACLVGSWYARDCKPTDVKKHAPEDEKLHGICDEFASFIKRYPKAFLKSSHRDRYYHDRSVDIEVELSDGDDDDTPIPDEIRRDAEKEISESARSFMRWYYKQLEAEYDYQTSDEAVDENIIANEYEFYQDGKKA